MVGCFEHAALLRQRNFCISLIWCKIPKKKDTVGDYRLCLNRHNKGPMGKCVPLHWARLELTLFTSSFSPAPFNIRRCALHLQLRQANAGVLPREVCSLPVRRASKGEEEKHSYSRPRCLQQAGWILSGLRDWGCTCVTSFAGFL